MAGFRWFQVISGWFQMVSAGFKWFQIIPRFSYIKGRVSGKFNGELEAK